MINDYFQRGRGVGRGSEQDLSESLIIEAIKITGQDFYYIQRTAVAFDPLFNENPLASFTTYGIIEMYVNNVTEFGGDGYTATKFGLDVTDTVELIVSKKRFYQEMNVSLPKEGDLIYWPLTRTVFQIDFVKDEVLPMYALSNLYTMSLKCSRFTYSYETFTTGVPHIDELNNIGNFVSNVSIDPKIPFGANKAIQTEANTDMDFTESNPFGTIGGLDEDDSNSP